MSIFVGARKCDLKILAEELGETVNDSHKLKDLKKIILASKEYDEESAKEWMNAIINERKEREENEIRKEEIAEQERQEEIAEQKRQEEIAEQKRQEEITERRRQDEIQMAERKRKEEQEIELRKLEYEERKRKDEMEFELQKIRLGAEGRSLHLNSVANQNVNSMQIKPKLEIHHLMQKFNSDENDISLYLIMFERLAKQAEILENTWVTHLLGLLPYGVAQLIAGEPDEIANDYGEVKKILSKWYKLTPEKFRQKFFMHNRNLGSTWKNFAYELRSFFNKWVNGVKADGFEQLSDLIITEQIKRKVSQKVKDHFIDDWSKLNSSDDLVEKLDDYDTLRSTFRSKRPRKEWHYDKQNSFKDDSTFTTNEKKRLYGITHNERSEPKCFHCSNFGHIARNCSIPKSVLTCREGNETGHKIINCVAKETNHSSDESLCVRLVGENSDESNSFLKKAKINNCDNVQALIDTGSSCCLLKISVAQKLKLKFERAVNKIYGFGNQKMPALTSIGRIKADIEVDSVKAENISIYVVPDDAQSVDLIIGRTWLDLPHIAYTKIGERVHIGYREDELFRNFTIDEKVNPVCLERLETAQSESENLQIKDTSQQKMMGNLANDLKMVKNELRLLQGDMKNFKEERQSLLLQIQEKNKNVDKLKSINDSLVKTNSYYDKNKSDKVSLCKGDIVAVRRKPNTTGESTKTQPQYRGPMVVTEVRPSDT
ncbi:hypothetical protein AVEN_162299-1 [Araneus ventricosus]|uniref:CCHC-type domain-containing protein n=1 Tax=Araneus ventricosus TaxID=182803 RepID=A0A4Y2CEB9_ARAVE|nr:hypothetical protein AVEN_52283-1 [Araneus ventricosus]GBM02250.1 hypothetical protein AVEN_173419-1 [Araneus ventricosus]GBM32796.1 hypothetical protein AVEN_196836-1 [Araneus ventricosus]GBM32890.1 hypothetical protein AVEN_117573-1 [Araneus ventricosus]GBM32892.1 hypothetical protein AVEN_140428-1 [Araneus ventricosus]